MKKVFVNFSLALLLAACSGGADYSEETIKNDLRAPAYPLLALHPHVRLWQAADRLTDRNMTFIDNSQLPLAGFLRVDGVMYRFMGGGLPVQILAPMGRDGEKWEAHYTPAIPGKGWEQPEFKESFWQTDGEGAFGSKEIKEVKTPWITPDIWVRREVKVDPYVAEHKKMYVRYSHDDDLQLYINGILLVDAGEGRWNNRKAELTAEMVESIKQSGKALIAAHCMNRGGKALLDFGLYAEDPILPVETLSPLSTEGERNGEWLKRTVAIDPETVRDKQLHVRYSHKDSIRLYVDDKLLACARPGKKTNVRVDIPDSIAEGMGDGKVLLSAWCRPEDEVAAFGLYGELRKAEQTGADVQATQTHYTFDCGDVELRLTFTAPFLLDDIEALARPVNYLSYKVKAKDGKPHDVDIYFEMNPQQAFHAGQSTRLYEKGGLTLVKTGKENQKLWTNEDKVRVGWGYFYMGTADEVTCAQGDAAEMRRHFMAHGSLEDMRPSDEKRYVAFAQELDVDDEETKHLTFAFDGLYAMNYFGEDLRPYWNKDGDKEVETLYKEAERDYDELMAGCYAFDRKLMEDATRVGGKEYAGLCALAYRQAVSGFQLAETSDGELLYFTPRVGPLHEYYPASPLFLCYNPDLVEAMLAPFFYYSESGKWTKPFAARDLGGYPMVKGQGGDDMPVEACGDALLMTAAAARRKGDATFAEKHWKTLGTWADYLVKTGVDTGDERDADGFAGRCPHNANLSIKSILAIAAYAQLAGSLGKEEVAAEYRKTAQTMAGEWMRMADGHDHYKLAFDKDESSWGMKYNLIWDRVLGLDVFPEEVARKESAFYLTKLNPYGCPLDERHSYTKVDWSIWSAALSGDKETFGKIVVPLYRFMNETTNRRPMTDWTNTDRVTAAGYKGRNVVGACFMPLLEDGLFSEK